jgi:hypothetical protein
VSPYAVASPATVPLCREELQPELAAYLEESDVLGPVLRAPLVSIVPYLPSLADGDWSRVACPPSSWASFPSRS